MHDELTESIIEELMQVPGMADLEDSFIRTSGAYIQSE